MYSRFTQIMAAVTLSVAAGVFPAFSSTPVRSESLRDRVAASRMKIRGTILYRGAWMLLPDDRRGYGVYEFPVAATSSTARYDAVHTDRRFGVKECFLAGDSYWTAYAREENYQILSMDFYTWDAATWEERSAVAGDPGLSLVAVAWSEKEHTAYAVRHGEIDGYSAYLFGRFDPDDGSFFPIGRAGSRPQALAVHADGTVYGIEEDGFLVTVDTSSGSYSRVIGQTGLKSHFRTDCAIDPEENVMYFFAAMPDGTSVYAVDLETAEAIRLYDLPDGEQLRGVYMWPDVAAAKVPAAPEEMKVEFAGRSLAGNVTFRTPGKCYDGTRGTGKLGYTVIADGKVYEGETAWGTEVSVPVEFDRDGQRRFAVRLSNSYGAGPAGRAGIWVGSDAPLPPPVAGAQRTEEGVRICWQPCPGSVHGGYFNPDEVTYSVIRREDGVLIGEGLRSTEVTDESEEPRNRISTFSYNIIPYSGECAGMPAVTAPVTIGYFRPYYRNTFADASSFDGFVTADGNGDGKTWKYYEAGQCVRIAYNTRKEMDDWLFSPEIELAADRECTFSFRCRAHDNETTERLAVAVASDTLPSAIVRTIVEPVEVKGDTWVEMKGTFRPTIPGRYRLAFHGMSDREQFYLYLDDITADDGSPAGIGLAGDESGDDPVQYYTVTGMRVARPLKGIYIEVKGCRRRKVVF